MQGVLLSGPPGTGKTLFARTLSKESGLPFVFASGAEFTDSEKSGAARINEMFATARRNVRISWFSFKFSSQYEWCFYCKFCCILLNGHVHSRLCLLNFTIVSDNPKLEVIAYCNFWWLFFEFIEISNISEFFLWLPETWLIFIHYFCVGSLFCICGWNRCYCWKACKKGSTKQGNVWGSDFTTWWGVSYYLDKGCEFSNFKLWRLVCHNLLCVG